MGTGASAPADRLVAACGAGDAAAARTAIADGAVVNAAGTVGFMGIGWSQLPLHVAVEKKHRDVVILLLQHGADPNAADVMYAAARYSTPEVLQLLIDAGGCVNRESHSRPPVFWVKDDANAAVLLGQPLLDLAVTFEGKTPEQCARSHGTASVAALIEAEVGGIMGNVKVLAAPKSCVSHVCCALLLWWLWWWWLLLCRGPGARPWYVCC